ncbi:hypothetical protein ElyMa_005948500 [Elysia marginata]|uniref:Uncharacterized protein n=1 Tax=Elysia marginata TaxID=1093978 RepID=A0AAV4GAP8_9GAST|nr:hypothetical protein ElyMa_005948500 [Elysia marginata]
MLSLIQVNRSWDIRKPRRNLGSGIKLGNLLKKGKGSNKNFYQAKESKESLPLQHTEQKPNWLKQLQGTIRRHIWKTKHLRPKKQPLEEIPRLSTESQEL